MILSFYKLAITTTCSISRLSPFSSKPLQKISPHSGVEGNSAQACTDPHVSRKQSIIRKLSVSLPPGLAMPRLFPHFSHHHERPCLTNPSPWSTNIRTKPLKETTATRHILFDLSESWVLAEWLLHHMLNNTFGWLCGAPSPWLLVCVSLESVSLETLSMGPSTLNSTAPSRPS